MRKIWQWIQSRRDERFRRRLERVLSDNIFLEQLQRVFQENKVMASPVFDGYLATTGDIMTLGKTNKPLDRIRQDIEHPFPFTLDVGGANVVPIARPWEAMQKVLDNGTSDTTQPQQQ